MAKSSTSFGQANGNKQGVGGRKRQDFNTIVANLPEAVKDELLTWKGTRYETAGDLATVLLLESARQDKGEARKHVADRALGKVEDKLALSGGDEAVRLVIERPAGATGSDDGNADA